MDDVDGRLDLDDQGSPRDHHEATRLDLVDNPGWGLGVDVRGRVGAVGSRGLGFAKRHKPGTAVAGGVLLTTIVVTVYLATRPPPVDPAPRITLVAQSVGLPDEFVIPDQTGQTDGLQVTYTIGPQTPGDALDVQGVIGPGLVSAAVLNGANLKASTPVTTVARVNCGAAKWWTALDGDYRVGVTRTDALGRVSLFQLPLGASARSWRLAVQQRCLRQVLAALPISAWVVHASSGNSTVQLATRVRNPNTYPLWLQPGWPMTGAVAAVTMVGPGRTATLTTAWSTNGCQTAPSLPSDGPADELPFRAGTEPFPATAETEPDPRFVGLHIPDSLRAELNARLAVACP